jgi:rRNA processing protein Gar1
MAAESLEKRVAALEEEVAALKCRNNDRQDEHRPWWEKIAGSFAGDELYLKAMALGRKQRESTRPKVGRRHSKRDVRA